MKARRTCLYARVFRSYYCPRARKSTSGFDFESITHAVRLPECIELSSVWILFLSRGDSSVRQPAFRFRVLLLFSLLFIQALPLVLPSLPKPGEFLFPWPLILLKTPRASLEPSAGLSGNVFGPTVYLRGLYGTSPCSVFVRRLKAKLSAVP